jgi:chemotaxis protein MotA
VKEIAGFAFIVTCVLGGFLMHHGQLALLMNPSEYMIIGGATIGSVVMANPFRVILSILKNLLGLLRGGGVGRKQYLETLTMLYELFQLSRKEGVLALEAHVNEPEKSSILQKYPSFTRDHHAVAFLCDTLKLFVAGVLDPHNMDELMERDLEVIHHEELEPSHALTRAADSLPALGIVAAVRGVILTMQSIDQGAAAVGQRVAGAIVGTFLGVFLAYCLVGPLGTTIEVRVNSKGRYYQVIRQVLTAAVAGVNPPMAVEIGRRSIATADRPTFEELEEALRALKNAGAAAAATEGEGEAGG